MDTEWPLHGRAAEILQFSRLLARRPQCAVVLAGAPGVGKTRLAREFLALVEEAGHATRWVAATESTEHTPFGAMASAVHPDPSWDSTDLSGYVGRAVDSLLDRVAGRTLTIFVDDAHLLDDASAVLIHQLVVAKATGVVLTVRSGEPAPALITALWKEGLAVRIDVPGLSTDAIEELLTDILGGQVDPALLDDFTSRCRANVALLREVVFGALDDGALVGTDGVWRLTRPLAPSERLIELAEMRLATLSVDERRWLEVLSYGQTLGSAELAAFGAEQVALDLEHKGWISATLNGRRLEMRMRVATYGDVLRSGMPTLRVRAIARGLAEAVEGTGARRADDLLRTMAWRLDAGTRPAGATPAEQVRMLEAARIARRQNDFPLAERLVVAALSGEANFEAELLYAQILTLRGSAADGEEHLARLIAPDDAARTQLAIARLDNTAFSLGSPEDGLAISARAEATITDPCCLLELAAHRAGVVLAAEGPAAGVAAAAATVAAADGRALRWACLPMAVGLSRMGRMTEARAVADRMPRTTRRADDAAEPDPWSREFLRCVVLDAEGNVAEAVALAKEQHAAGIREHSLEKRAIYAWQLTISAESRGYPGDAVRYGREAVTLFRELGRITLVRGVLPSLALALSLSGQPAAAQALLDGDELGNNSAPMWIPTAVPLARAWTAVARGDRREGRAGFQEAADIGEELGDLVGATAALHAIARTGGVKLVAARLTSVAANVEGPLARARVAHSEALLHRDLAALRTVMAQFSAVGADLLAAEAAADIAVLLKRDNQGRAATAAARTAVALIEACGRPSTPALIPAEPRALLTPAENETAALAALGYSSKEIADKLALSARTVDNRLRRIYQKLGIAHRGELSQALR